MTRPRPSKLVRRAIVRREKALKNRLKRHPCPVCGTRGTVRRSFGCAIPGDRSTEAFTYVPCTACGGTGHTPKPRD